ncbi:polysaccharide pyruvyl transferase family protein [Mesorhizobium microcysteis]|uniref:Polysaccharide pyruvyl transferase family protein n=1 Tax=Neoaquamicrobium microcysteis TaxID=2682781 RepID=A0A5D4GQD6_9HYPH|nr:polysaccharide pyruvyl transferase family protein [Mesorhizobium microcysteis]TYR30577.1 polysaccharide pyruvyl transferase family protein [Mesorhizobium microcysteis]
MQTIAIVDTSICTDNLGDEIIMDAVNAVVWELFPKAYIFRVPSHEALSDRTLGFIGKADFCFIGGTNLLSSDIRPDGLWRLKATDAPHYGAAQTVCLGTGWNDYMPEPTAETRSILKQALSADLTHAVRDNYTRAHLERAGLQTTSTCCPTTWSLTPEHCATIPTKRAPSAVFTLTAWRPDPAADRAFVELLRQRYSKVHFFPQMQDDWEYFRSFGWEDIEVVTPTTEGYTRFLESEDVDFIGTRLHGGIRALQKGRRALILAIDNRAAEIGKDVALPVVDRTATDEIANWIDGGAATAITIPQAAIDRWKAQFTGEGRVPATARLRPPPVQAGAGSRLVRRAKHALGRALRN